MRNLIIVTAIVFLSMTACFCSAEEGYKKYADEQKYRFSVEVPGNWIVAEIKNGLIFSGEKGTEEYNTTVTFQFIPKQAGKTLDSEVENFLTQMKTAQQFKLISKEAGKLSGLPSYEIKVSYQVPGSTELFTQEQHITETSSGFCWLGYTTPSDLFDKYHAAMEHAVRTVKFQ